MIKKKEKYIIIAIVLALIIVLFYVYKGGKKQAIEKLTIPPITNDTFVNHDYQSPPSFVVDASLFFDKETIVVSNGGDFDLIANVNPGSNLEKGINAVQLDINFDPAVLELSKIESVAPFVQMGSPSIDNKNGTISATFFIGGSQVNKISSVATLSFHAKAANNDSLISITSTSQATVNDGSGSMVLGGKGKAKVTISE
jgi:hypothetical protein